MIHYVNIYKKQANHNHYVQTYIHCLSPRPDFEQFVFDPPQNIYELGTILIQYMIENRISNNVHSMLTDSTCVFAQR